MSVLHFDLRQIAGASCDGEWVVETEAPQTPGPLQALLWREPLVSIRPAQPGEPATLVLIRLCHDRGP